MKRGDFESPKEAFGLRRRKRHAPEEATGATRSAKRPKRERTLPGDFQSTEEFEAVMQKQKEVSFGIFGLRPRRKRHER